MMTGISANTNTFIFGAGNPVLSGGQAGPLSQDSPGQDPRSQGPSNRVPNAAEPVPSPGSVRDAAAQGQDSFQAATINETDATGEALSSEEVAKLRERLEQLGDDLSPRS